MKGIHKGQGLRQHAWDGENGSMIWDGSNTDELVKFCVNWRNDDYSGLCTEHREFTSLTTGKRTLEIEPSDTMRGYGILIPINGKVTRIKDGLKQYLRVDE